MTNEKTLKNSVICKLLIGVILLDTVNFDEQYKKGTPKDLHIISQLKNYHSENTVIQLYFILI
jgi:hypothetical protein